MNVIFSATCICVFGSNDGEAISVERGFQFLSTVQQFPRRVAYYLLYEFFLIYIYYFIYYLCHFLLHSVVKFIKWPINCVFYIILLLASL